MGRCQASRWDGYWGTTNDLACVHCRILPCQHSRQYGSCLWDLEQHVSPLPCELVNGMFPDCLSGNFLAPVVLLASERKNRFDYQTPIRTQWAFLGISLFVLLYLPETPCESFVASVVTRRMRLTIQPITPPEANMRREKHPYVECLAVCPDTTSNTSTILQCKLLNTNKPLPPRMLYGDGGIYSRVTRIVSEVPIW